MVLFLRLPIYNIWLKKPVVLYDLEDIPQVSHNYNMQSWNSKSNNMKTTMGYLMPPLFSPATIPILVE